MTAITDEQIWTVWREGYFAPADHPVHTMEFDLWFARAILALTAPAPAVPSTGEQEAFAAYLAQWPEQTEVHQLKMWHAWQASARDQQRKACNFCLDQARAALTAPSHSAPSEPAAQQAIDAFEAAKNGLEWYRGRNEDDRDGSDDEMDAQIDAAITSLRASLPNVKADK